ncbi:HVC33 protein, partial [Aegotheles bennettii]|nr:HVC33 protein [Aegotheles bennettii]
GVWAQLRLVEAGGGQRGARSSVPPGDSVLLSCRGSSFDFKNFIVLWYRQAAGGTPEWVSMISSLSGTLKHYRAEVDGRAIASRVTSLPEATLSLLALNPWDSAHYFCAVRHS